MFDKTKYLSDEDIKNINNARKINHITDTFIIPPLTYISIGVVVLMLYRISSNNFYVKDIEILFSELWDYLLTESK